MINKNDREKLSTISVKQAEDALAVGLDRYSQRVRYTGTFLKSAGSIEFSDDQFAAMLQALKEDTLMKLISDLVGFAPPILCFSVQAANRIISTSVPLSATTSAYSKTLPVVVSLR